MENNESDTTMSSIHLEDKGTFQFSKTYGVVAPRLQSHVILQFEPEEEATTFGVSFALSKIRCPLLLTALPQLTLNFRGTCASQHATGRCPSSSSGCRIRILSPGELEALLLWKAPSPFRSKRCESELMWRLDHTADAQRRATSSRSSPCTFKPDGVWRWGAMIRHILISGDVVVHDPPRGSVLGSPITPMAKSRMWQVHCLMTTTMA